MSRPTKILRRIRSVVDAARGRADGDVFYPPGHFYSTIPSLSDIRKRSARIFPPWPDRLAGIDLNEAGQFALLRELATYYPDVPFPHQQTEGARYYFENDFFCQSDAIFLFGMLCHLKPSRIVEVGSGFSSAAILDTIDRFLPSPIACTFIEPYPERLQALLTERDHQSGRARILETIVQDVDPSLFSELEAGDIFFVDSSHVVKTGSDVAHIMFEVLPRLRSGVVIHFHDVFFPFEYPKEWVMQGRAWNEDYFLRAFLSYNPAFEIIAFNTYLAHMHRAWFEEHMPTCLENTGGSLWLRKR